MKIMIIGSGGRESALAWKLSQSENVDEIFVSPHVGKIYPKMRNTGIQVDNFDGLVKFAKDNSVDLTVVGPEVPLVSGISDRFEMEGLKIFGPKKREAQLEGSKKFAKEFMIKYNIPTAKYKTYIDAGKALSEIDDFGYPIVIKADGLCAGKGVLICNTRLDTESAINNILVEGMFGSEGSEIVMEEFVDGIEVSLLCFVSHNKIFPMESAKDFKRIGEGDTGLNTGGVACMSPAPIFSEKLFKRIDDEIIKPVEKGLQKENMDFTGILFIGLMICKDRPLVLEFNVRFGDPETEVVLPRLKSDLSELFIKALDGELSSSDFIWKDEKTLAVLCTSKGYPGSYEKGFKISGLDKAGERVEVFHNGTIEKADGYYTDGGRVLTVVGIDKTFRKAGERVYEALKDIDYANMEYRKDILDYA